MRIPFRQYGGRITLQWLDDTDVPWIAGLVDEAQASIGQPWRELLARLEALQLHAANSRTRPVIEALRQRLSGREPGDIRAKEVRNRLFGRAALDEAARTMRIDTVAATLGISGSDVERALWADLPGERSVAMPHGRPTELALAADANLLILQRVLLRCFALKLRLWGNARAIVRVAAVRGLLATAEMRGDEVHVDISGPLSLFHHTTVYGRALGSIVSHLPWCERFEIEVHCDLGRGPAIARLRPPLLLPPSRAPKKFDSQVEERFARDMAKRAPRWRVIREPTPLITGARLAFPDFVLEHRDDAAQRWWLEIVGFWTNGYLDAKLAQYRVANIHNAILCIDGRRAVDSQALPDGVRVVRYQRRVDVEQVLGIIESRLTS